MSTPQSAIAQPNVGIRAIERIFALYDERRPALLVPGRNLRDWVLDCDGKLRPLDEAIRRYANTRYGMLLVTYSMAAGLDWDADRIGDDRDRRTVETALSAHHLLK